MRSQIISEWCYESSFHLRDLMKGSQWHQGFHRPYSEKCCSEWTRVSPNWYLPLPPLHFGKCFFLCWTPYLPKLNWGPCSWAPLEENSPPRKWCQRVSSVWEGKWGDRGFPFGTGNSLYLKAPDPLITYFDFVTHQLNMCSYPRQKSDVVSKKNNIGPFISYGEEGDGNPLQYSCLENPMDGGAW